MANINTSPRTPIKRPMVIQDVKFDTESASKLFKRHYKEVAIKVLHITQVLRRNGHYALAQQAQDVVEGWFDTEQTEIAAKTEQMLELQRQKHIDVKVIYDQDKPTSVEVTSPLASRFLFLLEQLDILVKLMETLWMGGALNDDQIAKGTYQWERRIRRIAHKTRDLSGRLKAVSTKQGSPEELERIAAAKGIFGKDSETAATVEAPTAAEDTPQEALQAAQ